MCRAAMSHNIPRFLVGSRVGKIKESNSGSTTDTLADWTNYLTSLSFTPSFLRR